MEGNNYMKKDFVILINVNYGIIRKAMTGSKTWSRYL